MTKTPLQIHATRWSDAQVHLQRIRQRVFIDEQGVSPEEEWDDADKQCTHFLLHSTTDDDPVACARLLDDGHIGRVAVLKPWRGQGLGQALIEYILAYAKEIGQRELELDAQTHAISFYERLGFHAEGAEFLDAGIPHRRMYLTLPDPGIPLEFDAPRDSAKLSIIKEAEPNTVEARAETQTLPLGGSEERLDGLSAVTEALIELLQQSSRHIWIYSQHLEPHLFEQPALIEALSHFARRNAQTEIKILLQDTTSLRLHGHALLRLRQRIPSLIEIRQIDPDTHLGLQELILGDQSHWLELHGSHPMSARLFLGCKPQQQDLRERYLEAWHGALEPADMRSIKL